MAPYTERDLAEVTRGDDTTDSGLVEEKGPIHNDRCEDGKSKSPRSARQSNLDLEAQEVSICFYEARPRNSQLMFFKGQHLGE
jgi:hypothetical protein